MKKNIFTLILIFSIFVFIGCAGLKVVNPNDQNQNAGTLSVDASGGQIKLVSTYTCKIESMGNKFSALDKTEDLARKEVLAKCRDKTILSFCMPENIKCFKN
jgi:hypothetical protein